MQGYVNIPVITITGAPAEQADAIRTYGLRLNINDVTPDDNVLVAVPDDLPDEVPSSACKCCAYGDTSTTWYVILATKTEYAQSDMFAYVNGFSGESVKTSTPVSVYGDYTYLTYIYGGKDAVPDNIPLYTTLNEALEAIATEPEPEPEPDPETDIKRRKIVMNGGYALIDGTGIDLTAKSAVKIAGLHNIIYRSMDINKPIIIYNLLHSANGGLITPTGCSCELGENNLITVRTFIGINFTVATDDTVTIL